MNRLHFLGQLLRSDTGHAFHGRAIDEQPSADELEAITRRQELRVIRRSDLDAYRPAVVSRCADGSPLEMDETLRPARDYRLLIAVTCFAVVGAGALVALIMGVVH